MESENLNQRLGNLSPVKRALLELRLKQRNIQASVTQSIPRRTTGNTSPLSFSQERLWFLDQYEPGGSVYNVPHSLRLKGSLDIGVLERSINEIICRHESLRTTFPTIKGVPVQLIAPPVGQSLAMMDLSDHARGEEEARRLADDEAQRPFDLARGPLLRSQLLRLGEHDHVLLLTMHHIVTDGWSMGVFFRELSVFYQTFLHRQSSPLPELPIQYADYAIWQRQWLKEEVLERQLSYWKKQLEGIPAALKLPPNRPRPGVQSSRGATQCFVLSKDLTEKIKGLSRKEGTTVFMTLLAGLKILMYQDTGQTDLVVGSPIAGRICSETENLIGFFVNTLLLRTKLSGNPSFRELLKRVREVCLGAYGHAELPYQKLVEMVHPSRDSTRGSIARVYFAFQNHTRQTLAIPGLTIAPFQINVAGAKTPLTLYMREVDNCLAGSMNYSADLFGSFTVSRMMKQFETLLRAVVGDPERRVLDLPPLLERSHSELLEAIHWATEQSWHFESDATDGHDQGEF